MVAFVFLIGRILRPFKEEEFCELPHVSSYFFNGLNGVHGTNLQPVFGKGRPTAGWTMGGLANNRQPLPTTANTRHIFWKKLFDGSCGHRRGGGKTPEGLFRHYPV